MKKTGKALRGSVLTIALFAAAAVLILTGGITGARAALQYYSETYSSQVQMYDIGVSLLENGEIVAYRDYKSNSDGQWSESGVGTLLSRFGTEDTDSERFQMYKTYPEEISARNTGGTTGGENNGIDQYLRITLRKYWVDEDGNKLTDLDPADIDLHLTNIYSADNPDGAWLVDTASSTDERTVLYYRYVLSSGNTTVPLSDTLTVSAVQAPTITTRELQPGDDGYIEGYNTTTIEYDYGGLQFVIEAEVDAVQTHNAAAAMVSAWGITPTFADANGVIGDYSLNTTNILEAVG